MMYTFTKNVCHEANLDFAPFNLSSQCSSIARSKKNYFTQGCILVAADPKSKNFSGWQMDPL